MKLAFKIIFWVEIVIASICLVFTLVIFNPLNIDMFDNLLKVDLLWDFTNLYTTFLYYHPLEIIITIPLISIISVITFFVLKFKEKSPQTSNYWWKLLISGTLMTVSVYHHMVWFTIYYISGL